MRSKYKISLRGSRPSVLEHSRGCFTFPYCRGLPPPPKFTPPPWKLLRPRPNPVMPSLGIPPSTPGWLTDAQTPANTSASPLPQLPKYSASPLPQLSNSNITNTHNWDVPDHSPSFNSPPLTILGHINGDTPEINFTTPHSLASPITPITYSTHHHNETHKYKPPNIHANTIT